MEGDNLYTQEELIRYALGELADKQAAERILAAMSNDEFLEDEIEGIRRQSLIWGAFTYEAYQSKLDARLEGLNARLAQKLEQKAEATEPQMELVAAEEKEAVPIPKMEVVAGGGKAASESDSGGGIPWWIALVAAAAVITLIVVLLPGSPEGRSSTQILASADSTLPLPYTMRGIPSERGAQGSTRSPESINQEVLLAEFAAAIDSSTGLQADSARLGRALVYYDQGAYAEALTDLAAVSDSSPFGYQVEWLRALTLFQTKDEPAADLTELESLLRTVEADRQRSQGGKRRELAAEMLQAITGE